MSSRIYLAVVGYGQRGRFLFKMATRSLSAIAAAVCDVDENNLMAAGRDYPEAVLFTDFDRMLKEIKIDALLVETPATMHAELCIKALAGNIYVMSDVPAVMTLAEAEDLWQAHKTSQAWYMFGANPNVWGFVDTAAELVENGTLGRLYYLEAEYIHDVRYLFKETPWRKTFSSIRYCTHSLGPLLRLINEDLEWVSCFGTGSHVNQELGQQDAMVAIFRTRSNVVVRLLISFINNYPAAVHGYRVYGTQGYFERRPGCPGAGTAGTYYYSPRRHQEKALYEIPIGETPKQLWSRTGVETAAEGHSGADYVLLERFLTAVRDGGAAPISLREGLRMSIPGIAAADSAQSGGELMKIRYPWSDQEE